MKDNRKNTKKFSMVGGGEHAMFIDVSKTQAEKERMYEDKCDDIIYSKPVALVKKLKRRVKKINA